MPQMLEAKPGDPASGKTWAHPPAIFVHMARDGNTARAVAADMAALKKQARALSCHSTVHCWAGYCGPRRPRRHGRAEEAGVLPALPPTLKNHPNPDLTHCVQGVWTDELVVQPRPLTRTSFSNRSGPSAIRT